MQSNDRKTTTEGTPFTFDAAMETRSKRRKTEPVVDKIRRGEISVVVAIAEELPDVFYSEILPKLDLRATLNLAQVSKSYNDAVWSVDGVRSMEAKISQGLFLWTVELGSLLRQHARGQGPPEVWGGRGHESSRLHASALRRSRGPHAGGEGAD